MESKNLTVIDLKGASANSDAYYNLPVATVNDHVVRLSVMTEDYFWHLHPDSDESFMVVEGSLFIDLDDRTIELMPNQLFTIPEGVVHRTRPNGGRSVNVTFESGSLTTVKVER